MFLKSVYNPHRCITRTLDVKSSGIFFLYMYTLIVVQWYAFMHFYAVGVLSDVKKKVILKNIIITDIDNQNNIVFSVMIHPKNNCLMCVNRHLFISLTQSI